MKTYYIIAIFLCSVASVSASSSSVSAKSAKPLNPPLPEPTLVCGAKNVPPTAYAWSEEDRKPPRCESPKVRGYVPKFKGLAYDILNFESEACFVPDETYRILDEIVEEVVKRVNTAGGSDTEQRIVLISRTTSAVLSEMGFALWIPTETLSDAMILRRSESDKFRHIFDCDTGSMILLTISEVMGTKAFLVESTIPSNSDQRKIVQHNFVNWPTSPEQSINWDMNSKEVCTAPKANQLPYQGKNLTKQQLWAYETSLRAHLWERAGRYDKALLDYLQAMKDFPERPGAYNGFAWLVATKEIPNRNAYKEDALAAALKASVAREDANILDTLACVYAFMGNFAKAIEVEELAIKVATADSIPDFRRRLDNFRPGIQKDCTGEP